MKETQCQVPCQDKTQQNSEDIYFNYIMSEVASIAVEYVICLQQTKEAKEGYLCMLKVFDYYVAKNAKKKKVVKITPCSRDFLIAKEKLTDVESEKVAKFESAILDGMTVNEFTAPEYKQYLALRKKSNYLKGKLMKCVSTNFEFE